MKSFLIAATLLTLTACCGCMDKPMTNGKDAMAAPANLACSTAKVTGMTCEACASTVTANLMKMNGVKDIKVNVAAGTVQIYSDKKTPLVQKDVENIIERSGYKATSLQSNCN